MMNVLGPQHLTSVSPEYTSIPLSLSLNDLKSHSRSLMYGDDLEPQSRSLVSPGWNVNAAWNSPSAETTVKFSVTTTEECRSVRQHSIESSLSADVFIESDRTLWSYSQPAAVNSMLERDRQQRSVGGTEVFVSLPQSIGSTLAGTAVTGGHLDPVLHGGSSGLLGSSSVSGALGGSSGLLGSVSGTVGKPSTRQVSRQSIDSDNYIDGDVFSPRSNRPSIEQQQPPPLPPKTSVVSCCTSNSCEYFYSKCAPCPEKRAHAFFCITLTNVHTVS